MAGKKSGPRIRPTDDFILVKRLPKEQKVGSIFIPEEYATKNDRGEVLAVGPGKWNHEGTARLPVSVKPGMVVVMPQYAGAEDMRGALPAETLLIREEDLLGVEER